MPQDCVDHMRKAHDIPPLVKAANLARWFPPWTVTREQCHLFSRIGVPLFHCYRVFDRHGTHSAFRGMYMQRMHTFLEEADAASLRSRHRKSAREIVPWMSRTTLQDTGNRVRDVTSRPRTSHRSGTRSRKSTPPAAVAISSVTPGAARSICSNRKAVPALMDLALPKFAGLADRLTRPLRPCIVMTDSPASPSLARLADSPRSPSPCLYLDALCSEESTGPGDVSAVPICISDDSGTHVNLDQVLSDDDLPTAVDVEDRRHIDRIRDVPPEVQEVDMSWNDQPGDTRWAVWRTERSPKTTGAASQLLVRTVDLPPELRTGDIPPGVGTADLITVVRADEVPPGDGSTQDAS